MAKEKIIAINTFEGGINTDVADELLAPNMVRYALNVEYLSSGEGQVGIIRNIKGNVLIETPLPGGENITLGAKEDEENNCFYWFNWNSEGYHTIYRYDAISNKVTRILQSRTDSNDVDILKFSKEHLIIHIDIVQNNLLYWVDGLNNSRKINIEKCLDKSSTGYGADILEEYINSYKLPPTYAPRGKYFNDTTRVSNFVYGKLFKATARFIYDDGEKSNWSDFSNVPLPEGENTLGLPAIPTKNNGIIFTVGTGSRIVKKIEIAVRVNSLDFVSVAVLEKEVLGIPDNSEYDFRFYNDGFYSVTDTEKIARPYSFLPKRPALQAFVQNAMVYGSGYEGFDPVKVDASVAVTYKDLFIDVDIPNEFNNPRFQVTDETYDFERRGRCSRRHSISTLVVGSDVKKGNIFRLNASDGTDRFFNWTYTATAYDTATNVANKFRQFIQDTGLVLDMQANHDDGAGNISFTFKFEGACDAEPTVFRPSVEPVQTSTLKDTGESVRTIKAGSNIKYGIIYEDEEGLRKSLTYTSDNLVVYTKFVTETGGFKLPVHTLTIRHAPPSWAKYYQIVRTEDLTYDSFIQMLIQKAYLVTTTSSGEYLDLIIGSLYTYQRMHPNTLLKYQFNQGDRLRLMKWFDTSNENEGFYDTYETEIISYFDKTEEVKNEVVTCDGTDKVTVDGTVTEDNVGKFIEINSSEREIIGVDGSNKYVLSRAVSFEEKFVSYKLIDYRGVVRIRKPEDDTIYNLLTDDNISSQVELFKPSMAGNVESKRFYEFQKKYRILNYGTDQRSHEGNKQSQDVADELPALVEIGEGTTYVRNRELPTTNNIPGTQFVISLVEDASFSDFYESNLTDNGRANVEYSGNGEQYFGSRLRFSNNYIEDTNINGLNDFDNLDREDYNDKYGDIKRILYKERRLYVFKNLKTGHVPIYSTIIRDEQGAELLGTSDTLLNNISYFLWDGGVGDMPESVAQNGNWIFFVSPNSGIFARIGGDGVTPISQIYGIDKRAREILQDAAKYKARVFGGFDRSKGQYIIAVQDYTKYIYQKPFDANEWEVYDGDLAATTPYEILSGPLHGTLVPNGEDGQLVYTPDENYTGTDSFSYRVQLPGGQWSDTKNVCIDITPLSHRPTAWRPKASSAYCIIEVYWGNDEQSQVFTKNNCLAGGDGSDVNYVVPADTYFSLISQADADQKALDDIAANGQNYANENGFCTWYNDELSQDFTKNNCADGGDGSTVPYTVPSGTYSSTISKADANAKAQADINANGQNYANSQGFCTWWNDEQSQDFTRDNCGVDQVGTTVPYTVAAHTYSSVVSKADANQQALDDIAANGQAYANANGSCVPAETAWRGIDLTCELTNESVILSMDVPDGMYHHPETDKLFIANRGDNTVKIVDGSTLNIVNSLSVGEKPRMVVRIDAATVMSIGETGDIAIIDAVNETIPTTGSVPVTYTLGGFSVDGWGGDVAVLEQDSGNIYRVNKTTAVGSLVDTISPGGLTYGANIPGTPDLVVLGNKDGVIRVYNVTSLSTISQVTMPNSQANSFVTGLNFKVDGSNTYLFALNQTVSTVAVYTFASNALSLENSRTLLSVVNRAFYNTHNDTLYVSENPDRVYRLDPMTLETYESIVFDNFIRAAVISPDNLRSERIYIGDYGLPDILQPGTRVAVLGAGKRTGRAFYLTLEQYYVGSGNPTGITKPNESGDPDYIPPFNDPVNCSPQYSLILKNNVSSFTSDGQFVIEIYFDDVLYNTYQMPAYPGTTSHLINLPEGTREYVCKNTGPEDCTIIGEWNNNGAWEQFDSAIIAPTGIGGSASPLPTQAADIRFTIQSN